MSNSILLAIPEIGENQSNKYITHNNAISALEQASNAVFENLAVGGSQINVSEANFTRHAVFRFDGVTSNIDVTFPATVGGAATERVYVVHNDDSAETITVKDSTEAGTNVVLGPDTAAIIYQNGIDLFKIADITPTLATSYPYDVSVFIPDLPVDGVVGATILFARACTFDDDFAGSYGHCGTNPTSTATFNLAKNGSGIGSISISSGGAFTFATTGGATSFVAGDRLTITNPTPQDATLADVAVVFKGTRTGA